MIYQCLFLILLSVIAVTLGGSFITEAMTNAIDMQIDMQLQQMKELLNGN